MREIKFRAWDESFNMMRYFDSIWNMPDPDYADISNLMRYTGLKDDSEKEVWGGDIREYYGKIYKVVDDMWSFRLERNLVEFGENDNIIIDEDVAFESILKGNIYENPELMR